MTDARADAPRVLAWDGPTRIFKWTLVVLVADAWVSNKYGADYPAWHMWNGYAVLVAIVFRGFWGVLGGSTARFSRFVKPARVLGYLRAMSFRRDTHYLGHNPAGGLWIVAVLLVLAIQGTLGLFSADEERHVIVGPLVDTVSASTVDTVTSWHVFGFNVILALVVAHLLAIAFYDGIKRAGLVPAMIRGWKPQAPYVDEVAAVPGRPAVALLCLLAAIGVVLGAVVLLGGTAFR